MNLGPKAESITDSLFWGEGGGEAKCCLLALWTSSVNDIEVLVEWSIDKQNKTNVNRKLVKKR